MSELAIEVQGLEKTFRIPERRIDSVKERVLHPFARQAYRELRVLRGISFDVRRGEFFGIVGRNGSGKSTLLKILASIYRADAGRVLVSGQVAPLIELGVGFNPEFSARENVILNAVMMGLSPREAERRFDAVIDFAELHDYTELELKNYSSGMLVRLAFAVMTQVDAEILLIDEVLAVGDASFQQKCLDAFREMRDSDRTVVLISHDMTTVEGFCHRAMLIRDGEIQQIGDPGDVGRRYLQVNFDDEAPPFEPIFDSDGDAVVEVVDAHLEDGAGQRVTNVEEDEPIRWSVVIEARRELLRPHFGFLFTNADGIHVCEVATTLEEADGASRLPAGERVRLSGTIDNRLRPGRYFVSCWILRVVSGGLVPLRAIRILDFVVFGRSRGSSLVTLPAQLEIHR